MSVTDIVNQCIEDEGIEAVAGERVDYDGLRRYYENGRCR